jgi:hypothetical protein
MAIRKMNTQFTNKNTHIFRTDILQKQCGRELLFIGGRKRRAEEIFKFRVSEMPFPGLWGSFDWMLMVRKKRFSMLKFTICLQFIVTIQFYNIFSVYITTKILFYYYCRNFPNGQPDFLNMLILKMLAGGAVNHPPISPSLQPCLYHWSYLQHIYAWFN